MVCSVVGGICIHKSSRKLGFITHDGNGLLFLEVVHKDAALRLGKSSSIPE